MKEKIKSVGFWTALVGAVVLLLGAFGVEIGDETVSAAVNALCTILVLFGVITTPQSGSVSRDDAVNKTDEAELKQEKPNSDEASE